jgi:hypothetical protein
MYQRVVPMAEMAGVEATSSFGGVPNCGHSCTLNIKNTLLPKPDVGEREVDAKGQMVLIWYWMCQWVPWPEMRNQGKYAVKSLRMARNLSLPEVEGVVLAMTILRRPQTKLLILPNPERMELKNGLSSS